MSGSPVYIDGRLVGAVSYSLGQFSKEPIAGITPIDEMIEATTTQAAPRRQAARVDAADAADAARTCARRCGRRSRGCVRSPTARTTCRCSATASTPSVGTMLRPIATPLTIGGFDASVIDPLASAFREQGFLPMMAGAGRPGAGAGAPARAAAARRSDRRRAGDRRPRVRRHRHGHRSRRQPRLRVRPSVLRPRPDAVPDDARLRPRDPAEPAVSSSKLASTGEIIGTVQQDRATAIAGTLGTGPTLIPINLKLDLRSRHRRRRSR